MSREKNTTSVKRPATQKEAGRNMRHGLYCNPALVKVDGRSFFAKLRVKIKGLILDCFPSPPNAIVQALADGAAANLIICRAFQAAFLRGDELPPSILKDFSTLWNGVSRDLCTLNQLAREAGTPEPTPSLQEYLSKKIAVLDPEPATGDKPDQAKKTLF
jgi:hypothetical protein